MAYQPIESAQDFRRLIKIGETAEGLHLDFKQEVVWQKGQSGKPTDPRELCRDVAQFANTEGGVLLIGVVEKSQHGRKVATEVRPVDDPDGLTHWIEDAVTNFLVPNTFSKSIVPIELDEGRVLAVNIPPSIHLVALWDRHQKKTGIEYLRRTNRGKEWLNPDDVERHLMNGSRAAMLKVKEIFASRRGQNSDVAIMPEVVREMTYSHDGASFRRLKVDGLAPRLTRVEDSGVTIQIAGGKTVVVPHALIAATWLTVDERPALALKVQVVLSGEGLTLEPLP